MRRISKNVYAEVYFWGCNPGFIETNDGVVMIDSPQQPIDAVRWRELMEEKGRIRCLINTEPHSDHILGNAYFRTEVIGQLKLQACFDRYLTMMYSTEERIERMKKEDPDSVFLMNHPDYPASNPPTRTFNDELVLHVGNHTIKCIHMPGHTAPQTSIHIPEEGVVFTGDNIFHKCKTFVQEGDPWEWFEALKRIEALDVETIIPGHGEPCDKSYLKRQAEIVGNWVELVEGFIQRGMTEEEALQQKIDTLKLDPYPIGQRLFEMSDRLDKWNISNVYKHIVARKQGKSLPELQGASVKYY